MDPGDGRVRSQQLRDGGGVLAVLPEPRVERAQATQRQERVERAAGDAEAVAPPGEFLVQPFVPRRRCAR
jgi:hypothetical protein